MEVQSSNNNDNADELTCIQTTVGERLAKARKAKKLSVGAAAESLRVTSWIVKAIEQGDWDRLGPTVYARGYVQAYGRLLETDVEDAEDHFRNLQPEAPRAAEALARTRPPSWHRYQRVAAYVTATALVAVPAVWVSKAVIGKLWEEPAPITVTVDQDVPADASTDVDPADDTDREAATTAPVMASMAPMPTPVEQEAQAEPLEPEPPSAAIVEQVFELLMQEDAWLEVSDGQGNRLAFGLMPAGSEHRFPTADGLSIRIGNADQVEARLDGQPFDLEPHVRHDLAKLELPKRETD